MVDMVYTSLCGERYRLSIDCLDLRIPIPKQEFSSLVWEISRHPYLDYKGSYPLDGGRKANAHLTLFRDRGLTVSVCKLYSNAWIAFKWSPHNLREATRPQFLRTISDLVEGGFDTLIQTDYVGYVEIALDVYHKAADDIIIYRPRHAHSGITRNAEGGTTHYISRLTDKKRFCVYDKALEARARRARIERIQKLRIEVRLRERMSFDALRALSCPFSDLVVADLALAAAQDDSSEWASYLRECRTQGCQYPTYRLSAGRRREYVSRLRASRPGYWIPERLWSLWPEVCDAVVAHSVGAPLTPNAGFPI